MRLVAYAIAAVCAALISAAPAAAQPKAPIPAGDAPRGANLWEQRCTGCHALDQNRIGPAHRGVFGRRVGTAPDFAYSPALKKSRLVWDAANLDKWLTNPQALIPGQRMNFRIIDANERRDIIAYLRSVSPAPTSAPAKKKK
jgi:cytochrome c